MFGLTPLYSDSVGLGWSSEICIKYNASSGEDADAAGACLILSCAESPPLDNSGHFGLWAASAAGAKTAAVAAGAAAAASSPLHA